MERVKAEAVAKIDRMFDELMAEIVRNVAKFSKKRK